MLRHLLLASTFIAMPVVALASDLPSKSTAPSAPKMSSVSAFEGFYIGGFGGFGGTSFQGLIDSSELPESAEEIELFSGDFSSGAVYGGLIGYNVVQGRWVMGLEADLGMSDNSALAQEDDEPLEEFATQEINYQGSIRFRLRALAGNDTMLYATAGVAFVNSNITAYDEWLDFDAEVGSKDLTSIGYVVGAGVEHMITQNISLRGEGLYFGEMQKHSFQENELHGDQDAGDNVSIGGHYQIRAGLSYHF
jgi:outer membrane immunogenic protein